MATVVLGAGLAAILVGLVALVAAVRPWCGERGKHRPTPPTRANMSCG
jgi:hypothetical protein